jgi:hypothetical protein
MYSKILINVESNDAHERRLTDSIYRAWRNGEQEINELGGTDRLIKPHKRPSIHSSTSTQFKMRISDIITALFLATVSFQGVFALSPAGVKAVSFSFVKWWRFSDNKYVISHAACIAFIL